MTSSFPSIQVHFLANDDIATPTALVGKKVAPIYQMASDNLVMGESLDIIAKVDTDEKYGIFPNLYITASSCILFFITSSSLIFFLISPP